MKIEIVCWRKRKMITVEFSTVKDAFEYIVFNQPIEIEAIRVTQVPQSGYPED